MAQQSLVGQGLLIFEAFRLQSRHTQYDSSGRMLNLTQRLLPDNTQNPQETDIHAPGGFRTRNPSKRAAALLCGNSI